MSKIDGGLGVLFRSQLVGWHFQRIETGGTGLGIPDSNYCHAGIEGWVEFKQTGSWRVKVSPEQVGWAERRARVGGRVTMAVRQTGSLRDDLWLLSPDGPRMLRDGMRLDLLPPATVVLGVFMGGPLLWDWQRIAEILKRRL